MGRKSQRNTRKRRFSKVEALDMALESNDLEPNDKEPNDKESDPAVDPSSSDSEASTSASDSDPDLFQIPMSSPPSSETEEEPEEETETTSDCSGWKGKNGQVWSPSHLETVCSPPAKATRKAQPTYYATVRSHSIESTFDLFFTPAVIDLVVEHTNRHGGRTQKDWKKLDSCEFRAFLGLLIFAGIFRSKGETIRSLWDGTHGRAIFRATMSRNRFHQILRAVRFDDEKKRRAQDKKNKLAPIRSLWEMWRQRLPLLFSPGSEITIDEQMVPFKGKCKFKQFIPKKTTKYGLKIWMAADVSTSYAWKVSIDTVESEEGRELDLARQVVLDFLEDITGITVTCDNFFTSYQLGQELLKKKITMVGKIRNNKPELPPQLLRVDDRDVLSSVFAFTKNTTAVSHVPKKGKNLLLISTKHRQPEVEEGAKKKPTIVMDYNHCKGAVDTLDQLVHNFSCQRRSKRWPLTLFYNMLDISAYNAYVIFTCVNPSWKAGKRVPRRLFLQDLATALTTPAITRRETLPREPQSNAVVREIQSKTHVPREEEPAWKRRTCNIPSPEDGVQPSPALPRPPASRSPRPLWTTSDLISEFTDEHLEEDMDPAIGEDDLLQELSEMIDS
ncbi:piggyBac transposable element-derived protein 4-like [Xyrichtys novacula]|uniref:PiggyBac transposable element-derived protein 4-like n=1 Tax=Xyrichtys novacula TaxID=13765 RepID=A0AAV1ESX4_XYRNO|nr:piggyBac transposable element-derived protein 4-like [Xyrichtys novacula]